ncbi:MAG: aldehyde dehydrogenase family protein [Flammeovirgaceae bacterium TMED290]|nr:MAG: aldehyde dehydrogenase family protein [Flammeovirgaceae bacterium TMED290]
MQSIDTVFKAQQAKSISLRRSTAKERKNKLKLLLKNFLEMENEVLAALSADLGKSKTEALLAEIYGVKAETNFAIKNLSSWMKTKRVSSPLAISFTKSWVKPEPKGNVLIISPWNYPIMLCLNPLIAAISSGNTAVVKPSELTPASGKLVKKLIEKTFSSDEVAVFLGEKDLAEKLLELPFNHIMFTGSPRVGKLVMRAAAKHLAGVTLELGGKSPVVVDKYANIKDAAWKIAFYKFANAGQTCTAPDYVLCDRSVFDDLVIALQKNMSQFFANGIDEAIKDYCSIANEHHFNRLKNALNDAVSNGAEIACGGEISQSGLYFSPAVLTGVNYDNPIMHEEIFGPILPIVKVQNLEESISYINDNEKPLALYLFSNKSSVHNKVLKTTSSGGMVINDCVLHHMNPNLPFGGINNSGVGSYHGKFGFDACSHHKAVLKSSSMSPFKIMLPPYTKTKETLANLIKKYF